MRGAAEAEMKWEDKDEDEDAAVGAGGDELTSGRSCSIKDARMTS